MNNDDQHNKKNDLSDLDDLFSSDSDEELDLSDLETELDLDNQDENTTSEFEDESDEEGGLSIDDILGDEDEESEELEHNEKNEDDIEDNWQDLSEEELIHLVNNTRDSGLLEKIYRDPNVTSNIRVMILANRYVPESIIKEFEIKIKNDLNNECAQAALTILSNNPGISSQTAEFLSSIFSDDQDVLKMLYHNPRTTEDIKKQIEITAQQNNWSLEV